MKAEEAILRLHYVVDQTINNWGPVMLEVATSANTLLQNRIINTGYNAYNRQFDPYSKQYAKFREKKGRQIGFVDFSFSGRMWSSVQVVSSEGEHAKGMARISTLSDEQMQKLSGNTERKGTILDLNEKERSEIAALMSKRLTEIWHNQGL